MAADPTPSSQCTELVFVLDEPGMATLAYALAAHVALGDCLALRGDLGAGKTTLARALIRALLSDPAHEVPSPTFALRQDYQSARGPIAHFDLYRLTDPHELDELGFDEAADARITIVEWPERAEASMPQDRFDISLNIQMRQEQRYLLLKGCGNASQRIAALSAIVPATPA